MLDMKIEKLKSIQQSVTPVCKPCTCTPSKKNKIKINCAYSASLSLFRLKFGDSSIAVVVFVQ